MFYDFMNYFKPNFIIIGLFLFYFIEAQQITIRDTKTKLPLSDVNVYTIHTGTTTNENGFCDINIFDSTDAITISSIGYEPQAYIKSQIPKIIYLDSYLIPMDLINVIVKNKKSKRRYNRLERDVRKVYPYAKTVSKLLVKYESIIDSLELYSGFKKYYKKKKIFSTIEQELLDKYGYTARRLTRNQGRILIKLVDRETDRTSFQIIREFRSIFSATFWQLTARVFRQNLKKEFNPETEKEDRIIEIIINRIESKQN